MTFTEYAQLPQSQKIVLLEIDIPVTNDNFINYSSGIWMNNLSENLGIDGVTITGSDGLIGFYQLQNIVLTGDVRIGTSQVGNDYYTTASSITDLITQDSSIYLDQTNKQIYFHFKDFSVPWGKTVKIGLIIGFSDKEGLTNGAYYDDIYYDPRILNSMNISKTKDALFFGILQYNSGTFQLNNADGYFETLINTIEMISRPVRAFMGFDGLAFADFRQIFNGKVQDYNYDRSVFNLNIVDVRKFMTDSMPANVFTATEYPYMDTNNVGKVKPIVYGVVRKAPIVCVNETQTGAATWNFYVADISVTAPTSIGAVYLNDILMAPADWSYSNGIISIADGKSVSDTTDTFYIADNLTSVSCNITTSIVKGADILKDVLDHYGRKSYIATNYDLAEWALATLSSRNMGLYLNEADEISKVIERVCVSDDACFIVKDDGRFTYRIYDENRTVSKTIRSDEWLESPAVKVTKKLSELLSSVKVKYNKDLYNDEYLNLINTTYESEVYAQYDYKKEKSFDTDLSDLTGATDKALTIITRSKDVVPTIKRATKTQNIDLEVMDFIIAEHSRESATTKDWAVYEVIGITKDLNKSEVTLDMKYVKKDETAAFETYIRADSDGNWRVDSDGNTRIVRM